MKTWNLNEMTAAFPFVSREIQNFLANELLALTRLLSARWFRFRQKIHSRPITINHGFAATPKKVPELAGRYVDGEARLKRNGSGNPFVFREMPNFLENELLALSRLFSMGWSRFRQKIHSWPITSSHEFAKPED